MKQYSSLLIQVRSIESDTHTLFGYAQFSTLLGGVSVYLQGGSWHSYLGCPGYQGFDRERFAGSYKSVVEAEKAGWVFGTSELHLI